MAKYPSPLLPDFYNDIVFTFKILSVRKKSINGNENTITEVNWSIHGKYNNYTAIHVSDTTFSFLEEQTEFTTFSELSESKVQSWIMDDEDYEFLKANVATKLNYKVKSEKEKLEVTTSLPWS
jgi:hypothetical protein